MSLESKQRSRRPSQRGRRAFLEQLEDRSLMAGLTSPALDTTIEAVDALQNAFNNGGAFVAPPDTHGAVGPSHVVNVTNNSIEWYTKSGTLHYSSSLSNFFRPLQPVSSGILTDPKVLYDTYAARFVVVYLEILDPGIAGSLSAIESSRMMLAVSDDSDPNGTWNFQSVNTGLNIGGGGQWMDYPGFALDEEALYVTGTMFPFTTAATALPGGSRLWIVDKGRGTGGLYDGGLSTPRVFNPAGTSAATTATILQPALMYSPGPAFGNGGSQVGTWLAAYDGNSSGGNERVTVIRVDNPLAATPVFTSTVVDVGNIDDTLNTAFPAAAPVAGQYPVPLPGGPQAGTRSLIDWNDRRMNSVVWRNNSLYAVTQVLPPSGPDINQVTAHWFRIDTSNPAQPTLADQGNIGGEDVGSTVYTSYASVAVDAANNMAVAFSATSPGMYPGFYYATRAASDPAGTMRRAQAIAYGLDAYVVGATTAANRWGDYSAITLDPSDGVSFWAYGQYSKPDDTATGLGLFGTRWGAFHMGDLPAPPPGPNPPPAFVTGTKWNDLDKDGVQDTNEFGVGGFTMYVDVNANNRIDIGEPAANADAIGRYTIESSYFGTYAIREVDLTGWTQTFPGPASGYEHTVTLVSGQTVSGINFGNNGQVFDFGDAPAPYPTTLAANGARAGFRAGFHLGLPTVNVPANTTLGVEADTEADGQPDPNAEGDDLNGTDDEDGVLFPASGLVAGAAANLQITVSNAGGPSGAVQAWIDFNGDGNWSAGEQVIKDLVLTQGVHNVSINVPATATSQLTFARFRYGYERNIGPTGVSLAGEVEDYAVQIISDQPVANDDARQFNQNSSSNIVDVLANDFASSAGGLRLQSVATPNRGGTAVIDTKGTPSPADDVVLYTPVRGFIGTETFSYVVTDNSGKTDSALVTITVVSLTSSPVAVDDSFTYAQAAAAQLDVLANDVAGDKPPVTITAVAQPAAGQGTVTIIAGGTLLQYSPPSTTFVGDVQFSYTISDSQTPTRRTSSANVTLHVGNTTADDQISIQLRPYDLNGNPISVINPGQEFELRAFVQDLRTDDTVGNPTDNLGVYAAYFDMLYENNLVSLSGPVVFNGIQGSSNGGPWNSGQTAGTNTQGLIDESGAFQGGSQVFTSDELELYRVRMRANGVGQADFAADPADVLPLHDSLVFQPPSAVPFSQITYGTASLFIGDPAAVLFKAVDDTVTVPANSGNVFIGSTTLQVMTNDLKGLNTPVVITSVTPLGTFQGSLARSNSNTTVTYTAPSGGFVGVQQFKYTLQNALGATSEATVTMKVGSTTVINSDDLVQIRLATTDAQGNPITSATVGSNFQIRAFVSDLRSDDGDGNSTTDNRGVYAAYLDVLYSYQFASFVGVEFNTVQYNNGKKGDGQIPGLIDEVGAFQTNTSALGAGEVRLFTINLRASAAGTFTYQGDPRDVTPLNDVTLFSPPTNVAVGQVRLNGGQLTIGAGGGGEAEFTNPNNPMDVNGDGFVTPLDVLLVINDMNAYGARVLTGGGAGEAGSGKVYLDVNADRHVSSIDALLVVNYLNFPGGSGEGEGVDAASVVADEWANADPLEAVLNALVPGSDALPIANGTDAAPRISLVSNGSSSGVYVVPVNGDGAVATSKATSKEDGSPSALDSLLDDLADDVAGGWAQV